MLVRHLNSDGGLARNRGPRHAHRSPPAPIARLSAERDESCLTFTPRSSENLVSGDRRPVRNILDICPDTEVFQPFEAASSRPLIRLRPPPVASRAAGDFSSVSGGSVNFLTAIDGGKRSSFTAPRRRAGWTPQNGNQRPPSPPSASGAIGRFPQQACGRGGGDFCGRSYTASCAAS